MPRRGQPGHRRRHHGRHVLADRPSTWVSNRLVLLPATFVLFWAGGRFLRAAWKAARHGGVTMDTLVAIGDRRLGLLHGHHALPQVVRRPVNHQRPTSTPARSSSGSSSRALDGGAGLRQTASAIRAWSAQARQRASSSATSRRTSRSAGHARRSRPRAAGRCQSTASSPTAPRASTSRC